jgi:cytosine/adenosine deaminase-related metal-dependent hydrolase
MTFALHVAEGVDRGAAEEVRTLAERGLLTRNLLAVHAVGADADGIAKLRASGAAIVWCPTSNRFLFGCTAPEELLAEGIDVLLGTDSLLTGAGTLLDELHAVRGIFPDARLLDAVGAVASRRLGFPTPSLTLGGSADLVALGRSLPETALSDVALVMAGGKLRVLDPDRVAIPPGLGGRIVAWNGIRRWISQEMSL